jgi:hypothetical protein
MKNIFEINSESELTAALAAYCEANKLPKACAMELLADCQSHVVWLASFIDQWEKVTSEKDRLWRAMLSQGFKIEQGGGGCSIFSRYMPNEAFVWITCIDGGGLPEANNWMVCAYGEDIGDILFEASSESGVSLEQAAAKACDIARDFQGIYGTCRNGLPWSDCDCC